MKTIFPIKVEDLEKVHSITSQGPLNFLNINLLVKVILLLIDQSRSFLPYIRLAQYNS